MNTTGDIEIELSTLPDRVADALGAWKKAEVEKRREHARLYLTFKAKMANLDPTSTELKSMVEIDPGYYQLCLDCVTTESEYVRLMERLLSLKKLASIRAAF